MRSSPVRAQSHFGGGIATYDRPVEKQVDRLTDVEVQLKRINDMLSKRVSDIEVEQVSQFHKLEK